MFGRLNLQNILVGALMLLTVLPFHECAHAFVAYKLGDPTAKFRGRLTLNPLRHLDPVGTLAFLLVGFGWGNPVPVYEANLRHPKRDMALVALAGPVSNIVLATGLVIVQKLLFVLFSSIGFVSTVPQVLIWILGILASTSVHWAVFNLIPVPPLDGSRLLEYVVPNRIYNRIEEYQRYIYFGMLLLLLTGLLDGPIQFISNFIWRFIDFITLPLNLLMGLL